MKKLIYFSSMIFILASFGMDKAIKEIELIAIKDNPTQLEDYLNASPTPTNPLKKPYLGLKKLLDITTCYFAPKCVTFLVKKDAPTNNPLRSETETHHVTQPLFNALRDNLYNIAEILVTNFANPNGIIQKEKSWTLLEFFAGTRADTQCQWLLEHGADPDLHLGHDITPLQHVCTNLDYYGFLSARIIKILLQYANPNVSDLQKRTCLHSLIQHPVDSTHLSKVKLYSVVQIVAAGADVNTQTLDGQTPLHYAVLHEEPTIAAYLLCKGTRKDLADKDGKTPLQLVKDNPELYEMLASDVLPPMPVETAQIEIRLNALKQKIG